VSVTEILPRAASHPASIYGSQRRYSENKELRTVTILAEPRHEAERLAALRSYNILDTPPEPEYEAITALIAELCAVPIALVSLVDENRQWFKSNCGLSEVSGTSRDVSFCTHAIEHKGILEIPDTLLDPRFAQNPLVLGEPFLRFYAGAPLVDREGMVLGTLCVADRVPRRLTLEQWSNLARLAISITNLIVGRKR